MIRFSELKPFDADLERLWRTDRPSVRAKCAVRADTPTAHCAVRADTPTAQSEPVSRSFAERLVELGLTNSSAAKFLGCSPRSVATWKREGAPADIMAQLGAPHG